MTEQFEVPQSINVAESSPCGISQAAAECYANNNHVRSNRQERLTYSEDGNSIIIPNAFESGSNTGDGNITEQELRNSMTYVEGQRVTRDKNGNTVIDRSHVPNLPDNHPVKEVHGRHGTVYHYKDGRVVHVDEAGYTSVEEFDPKSGSMVHRIIGTPKTPFNPLL